MGLELTWKKTTAKKIRKKRKKKEKKSCFENDNSERNGSKVLPIK